MKIKSIRVKNYRLLKDFSIDLESELSLVLGKNNTGKTSLLKILEKFLQESKPAFKFDDFNLDFKNEVEEIIEGEIPEDKEYLKSPISISLRVIITYEEGDNLANVSNVMMDLDPENNVVVLGYDYFLPYESLVLMKESLSDFKIKEANKKAENDAYQVKSAQDFLKLNQKDYFKNRIVSIEYDKANEKINEEKYIDLSLEGISTRDILNFKYISAKRDVTNKEVSNTLSRQTSQIYQKSETSDEQNIAIDEFKDQLAETDLVLTGIYESLFSEVVEKVRKFGGIKEGDSTINIESTLQHRNLLEGNTTVMYDHGGTNLPEYNNGLGYMNLISIIFEIEILINEFKRSKQEKPADINLLFVEEPEAHTHPQMQYVFIKNIKSIIGDGIKREDGNNRELQTIISTHSSHIVSESDFDDIKYLIKEPNQNSVKAKNLTSLKTDYDLDSTQYHFLTQYLTLSRAEIFFADKAIFIEGDTERILMPTFMRKFDRDEERRFAAEGVLDTNVPLISQNISVIEVGAYSHIFEKFIEFTGIKTLIITDIDTTNAEGQKHPVEGAVGFSNSALENFYSNPTLEQLMGYGTNQKIIAKDGDGNWQQNQDGKLSVIYQVSEAGNTGRSFEEAFIIANREFVKNNRAEFKGLQNRDELLDDTTSAYILAYRCIKKKTHFALDIVFHTNEEYTNWQIPLYIKEGLLWLKQD